MPYLLPLLILAGCAVALQDWRRGVFAAIAVGLVQDPLRKMMPGTPGIFAMASVPVWLTVIGNALLTRALRPGAFLARFPRMGRAIGLFAAYLALPAAISASYGRNSWQITMLGAVFYGSALLAMGCGWRLGFDTRQVNRLLAFYAVFASVLLLGGILEYLGWNVTYAAIGTEALGHVWVTYRTGAAVHMISGFFRGPDVMGWHAALVFMVGAVMAVRARGAMRIAWIAAAAWGALGVWLCGRRKMVAMLPVFFGVFLALLARRGDVRRWALTGGTLLLAFGLGWYVVTSTVYSEAVEQFYVTAFTEAEEQIRRHAVDSLWVTVQQAGFLGYGLGMGQQGVHHINAEMPRIWQESGPSKLFAELGVPGALLFLFVLLQTGLTAIHVVLRVRRAEVFLLGAGLLGILAANLLSALVSAQIFGDPLVAILLALLAGILLAGAEEDPEAAAGAGAADPEKALTSEIEAGTPR